MFPLAAEPSRLKSLGGCRYTGNTTMVGTGTPWGGNPWAHFAYPNVDSQSMYSCATADVALSYDK
jgi:hypothetical protein